MTQPPSFEIDGYRLKLPGLIEIDIRQENQQRPVLISKSRFETWLRTEGRLDMTMSVKRGNVTFEYTEYVMPLEEYWTGESEKWKASVKNDLYDYMRLKTVDLYLKLKKAFEGPCNPSGTAFDPFASVINNMLSPINLQS